MTRRISPRDVPLAAGNDASNAPMRETMRGGRLPHTDSSDESMERSRVAGYRWGKKRRLTRHRRAADRSIERAALDTVAASCPKCGGAPDHNHITLGGARYEDEGPES